MCGIAGMQTTSGQAPSMTVLNAMSDALTHRGPDGEGSFVSGATGLMQTRLAIIDLETGDQPLFDDEGLALVANGEIYNYLEFGFCWGVYLHGSGGIWCVVLGHSANRCSVILVFSLMVQVRLVPQSSIQLQFNKADVRLFLKSFDCRLYRTVI